MVLKKQKRGSINRTLITWFLILSLTPLSAISIFSYYQSSNSLIEAAHKELEHSAQITHNFVTNWIDHRFMDIHTQAGSPGNWDLLTDLKQKLKSSKLSLAEFVKSDLWYQADSDSKQSLYSFILTYDYVYDAFLIDPEGNILFSLTKQSDFGKNIKDDLLKNTLFAKSIQSTIDHKTTNFSGIERYAPSNNALSSFFTAPLIDDNNHFNGVVAVQVSLDHLFYILSASVQEESSLRHYFVGQDRKVRTPMKRDNWQDVLTREITTTPALSWYTNQEQPKSHKASTYVGPNGKMVIGYHKEIVFDNFNWLLISEIDLAEANASTLTLQKVTIIFVIFTSWMVFLISFSISKKLTSPLQQLTDFAQDIQYGIKDQIAIKDKVTTNNEIGTLAQAFYDMVTNQELNEHALKQSKIAAEQALHALDEQKFALDQHAIVAITNGQGTITFANKKFSEISGYNVQELMGKNHRILKSGFHDEVFYQEMWNTISSGQVWHGEVCNKAKNGRLYWVDTTIVPFFGNNKRPISYISIRTDITQRKTTELYLEENSKQLELVISATQVGIWDWSVTTGDIDCNDRWFSIAGYTRADFNRFTAKNWQEMIHADDLKPFKVAISEIMKGNTESFDCELRIKHKQGHWIWVVDSGKVVEFDENNCPSRIIGTLLDISKLKETEQGLARVQAFSNGIFNSVADGIISIDKHGIVQSFNPAAEAMYGYQQDEIVGKNVTAIIPEQYREQHIKGLNRYLTTNQSKVLNRAIELEGLTKTKEKFPVELTVSQVNINNELYFTALARDITERKKTELQQQRLFQNSQVKLAISRCMAEQKLLKVRIDDALTELYQLNDQGIVSQATILLANDYQLNNSVFSSYGELSAEVIKRDEFVTLCHEISEQTTNSGEIGYQQVCEHPSCNKLFSHKHSHYTLPLIDRSSEGSNLLGVLIITTADVHDFDNDDNNIFKDISEIITAAILRENARELLKQASITAEQNSQLKSEFLASMSHEIRTPMNGVLGMLGLLINSNLTKDQEHKALIAQSSAESLLTLINDILDFSKVEAGKMELEIIDFNLKNMLGDFAKSIAHKAQDKGLELILDLTKVSHEMIKGDPGRIRQILTNLVGNAIKFTHQGDIIIRAKTHYQNHQLTLSCEVEDTGIGIPAHKLAQLFTAFTQVDASTTRKYGGTGLGLSISKKLAQLMRGNISATSTLEQGSTFSLSVAVEECDQQIQAVPHIDIKALHILIVDDNQTNREVLASQLAHWGAKVTEASSAKQAIELCEQRVDNKQALFDVAFLDMQMPDINGATLGQKLHNDARFSTIHLVMMTSISQHNEPEFFANIGFKAFFTKPATTSDIFDSLAVVIEGGTALEHAKPLITHEYLQTLDHTENEKQASETLNPEQSLNWPEKTRLLLVEDNRINQIVALGVLKEFNLSADVAANGLEAITSIKEAPINDPYTLVIMDCQMPEMDGYQATKEIRAGNAGARNTNIPIIAMTANAMEGDKQKCLDTGMNDYLSKPIDSDDLLAKLRLWLLNDTAPTQAPSSATEKAENVNSSSQESIEVASASDVEASTLNVSNNESITDESNSEEVPIWDKESALKRVRNNHKLLSMLINTFVDDVPQLVDELKQAIEQQNTTTIHRVAHTLKGSSGNLSGLRLQAKALELEQAAKAGKSSQQLEQQLFEEVDMFINFLKENS